MQHNLGKNARLLRVTAGMLAIMSLWFMVTLGLMMAWGFHQSQPKLADAAAEIARMRDQLPESANDEAYRARLRELDLVYRRAFFADQGQRDLGWKMLQISFVFAILGLGGYCLTFRYSPPEPRKNTDWQISGNFLLGFTGIIVLAAGAAVVFLLTGRSPAPVSAPPHQKMAAQTVPFERYLDQWSQFRGLGANFELGKSPYRQAWRVKVPLAGFSSPIVWGDHVFATGADKRRRAVFAFDANDGKLLWRAEAKAVETLPEVSDDTGYAAPTPATDGERVYAVFATGQVLCTDVAGRVLWEKDFGLPEILYGYANSPLLFEKYLILQFDTEAKHILYALDVTNGEILWQNERPDHHASSWATPVLAYNSQHQPLVVTLSSEFVEAFQLADGKSLWCKDYLSGEIAASAAYSKGVIYTAHSGNAALAINPDDGATIWKNTEPVLPDVASPAADGKNLYLVSDGGVFTALNAADGSTRYTHDFEHGFYASVLVSGDGVLLLADKQGMLRMVKGDVDEYTGLAGFDCKEPVLCTPAVAGKAIYIRTFEHLIKLER